MQAFYEEAADIARELRDPRLLSWALFDLSFVSMAAGRPLEGNPLLEEALAIADESDLALRAELETSIGFNRLFSGDTSGAAEPLERGIALQREAGERLPLCESLLALAGLRFVTGDIGAAQAHLEEGTAIAVGSPSPIIVATVLAPHALFANQQGHHRRAAVLLGAWARLEREYEVHFPEIGLMFFGDPADEARAVLGDEAFGLAFAEGEAKTLDEVVELVSDLTAES